MSCYGQNDFEFTPYPSTDDISPDKRMAKALCDSRGGEMSSINAYVYYSIMFADTYPDLAEMFGRMAEMEMIHFKLLSECILRLGGNPSFSFRLAGSAVRQGVGCAPIEADRCIDSSMQEELAAVEEYKRLVSFTCDRSLIEVLERLASDEEKHFRTLESFCL